MKKVIEAKDGGLYLGEPITVAVIAILWTHKQGGSTVGARELGMASSLRDAERKALDAGYTLRQPARFMDMANGIHVPVLATEEEKAE